MHARNRTWGHLCPALEIGCASFLGRDRMGQWVPSPRGRARIAGGATLKIRCQGRDDVLNPFFLTQRSQKNKTSKIHSAFTRPPLDSTHSSPVGSAATYRLGAPEQKRRPGMGRLCENEFGYRGLGLSEPSPPFRSSAPPGSIRRCRRTCASRSCSRASGRPWRRPGRRSTSVHRNRPR